MATLVFLEHHEGELEQGALGVLSKAASLGDAEVAGALVGAGVKALAAEAGRFGAAKIYVADDPAPEIYWREIMMLLSPASSALRSSFPAGKLFDCRM